MTRRPAVTLMEVLVAMFIMAIGMLALLALFPVGAVSMAQALKDDRCASTAAMAENVAIINNVRYGDTNVLTTLAASTSGLVYVDPYGVNAGLVVPVGGMLAGGNPIPRVRPSFITIGGALMGQLTDRWFSLPDDITFTKSGTADLSAGAVDRGRRYSYAYLLRRFPNFSTNLLQLYVVVYSGRPVNSLAIASGETPNKVTAVSLPNGVQVINSPPTTAKRGGWILDTSGNFYRVTNITDSGGGVAWLETQQNLQPAVAVGQNIIVLDNVAEVFDKGTGWRP